MPTSPRAASPSRSPRSSSPPRSTLADRTRFVIGVRNTGSETIPNIAVTLDGLDGPSEGEDAAEPQRPIWVLESGPQGSTTAYVDTWAKGALPPGETARFEWDVTAVEAGTHRLTYAVAAGLDGKARAQGEGGRPPAGEVTVAVRQEPADARVDPETGEVLRDRDGRDDQPPDPDEPLPPLEEDRGGE